MISNIPDSIKAKIGKNLHNNSNHPLCILKNHIYKFFDSSQVKFDKFDDLDPVVSLENNFDSLLIPKNHPARSKSDTYYVDDTHILRTHTSAHQVELFKKGYKNFLVSSDVYRKDEIDHCHYPIFHQMEIVQLFDYYSNVNPEQELKKLLSNLIKYLFNTTCVFSDDYFPFTTPSFEVNIDYNGKTLEVLGCGVIHETILNNTFGKCKYKGIAAGLGLERLCMILFKIPDIRLFWTDDNRFLNQFSNGTIKEFIPYPILDPIYKDISFWINESEITGDPTNFSWINLNNFYELIRNIFDDNISNVNLFDKFYNKKKNLYSHTFRLCFSPIGEYFDCNSASKFNEYCNSCMNKLQNEIIKLDVTLR